MPPVRLGPMTPPQAEGWRVLLALHERTPSGWCVIDLLRFFDHFLKGADNGWEKTPRVRYSLLDIEGGDVTGRPAPCFPPPGVTRTPFYLDGAAPSLASALPKDEQAVSYDAESRKGRIEYTLAFDRETEIVGYPKLRLWVQADGHDDMDLFVFLQKLDRNGKHLEVQNSGVNNPVVGLITHFTASVLKYHAAPGCIRVSLRHPDPQPSTPDVPVQSFDRVQKLQPGQIVDVEIPVYAVGLLMHPGEQLRLIVTGHNIIGGSMPLAGNPAADNHGRHIIHTGGQYDSCFVLPIHRGAA